MRPALRAVLAGGRWSPQKIAGQLEAWWDASDAGTVVLNGSTVSAWNSKVGAISAVQATGANQPTYTAAGQNGLPVITFGGSHWLSVASVSFGAGSEFVVGKVGADSQGFFQHGAVNGQFSMLTDITAKLIVRRGGTAQSTITYVAGSAMLAGGIYTSNLSRAFLNGVAAADDTSASALSTTATNHEIGRLGASTFQLNGFIAERVRYSGQIDDPTRFKIEGYLAWKWGLQGSLPASHPYKGNPP